jgi:GTPase
MNALLETDLSVATSRPQTTRHAILGLMTSPNRQVCLLDTPGVLDEPAYRLQEGMMEAVMGAFHDADCLLIVTDVFSTPIPKDALFRKVQTSTKPILVVINKVDLFDGALLNRNNGGVNNTLSTSYEQNDGRTHSVQDAVARWRSWLPQALLILPLSALSSKTKKDINMNTLGVSILRKVLMGESNIPQALRDLGRPIPGMFPSDLRTISDEIARDLLPLGPPLYESDALTDRSERFFASELIRSALFENLRKELPYCCEVRVTKFQEPPIHEKEDNDGKVKSNLIRIQADVIVERDSQKGIVVGKRGSTIRTISIDARAKLEHFFQSPVYLELQVKVENEWRKNEDTLKKFGYLR